ncbi:hypothetical protein [Streptomyces sp. NPDC015131]|uniref:hypothetical protein n=1 Tax=Streptomyces sp. NPDC015131 TaxID=3364941 RepID=UPI00370312AC
MTTRTAYLVRVVAVYECDACGEFELQEGVDFTGVPQFDHAHDCTVVADDSCGCGATGVHGVDHGDYPKD